MNLQLDSKFRDNIPCASATTTIQEPKYNASIKYMFTGLLHRANQSASIEESYVIEFIGMRDAFASGTINGPGGGTLPSNLPAIAPNAWLDGTFDPLIDGNLDGENPYGNQDGSNGGFGPPWLVQIVVLSHGPESQEDDDEEGDDEEGVQ